VPLTISVGIAVYPDHGQTASALCAAADTAMYLAKERGRNCVAMAHLHDRVHNQ
jgi:diguanylate cyclase (GGDEF)-like protein